MRIGLIGMGKMGKTLTRAIAETKHEVKGTFDIDKPPSNENVKGCDVLIDFSNSNALEENLNVALESGIPLVTGTTGWYNRVDQFKKRVEALNGSFLYASNFSIGVILFHKLLSRAAVLYNNFDQYDFALHETHHSQKADNPSGTALTLADEVLKNLTAKDGLHIGNPEGKIPAEKMQLSSLRVGNVPGTHTLFIESAADSIEITHRAHGRMGFANGAIKAAEWLIGKTGFFTIEAMVESYLPNTQKTEG